MGDQKKFNKTRKKEIKVHYLPNQYDPVSFKEGCHLLIQIYMRMAASKVRGNKEAVNQGL